MISRRRLVIALGASALATPLASFAQQRGKVARIGFLYFASRQSALDTERYNAFMQGMRELGYVSGTNLVVEEHYADSKVDRVSGLADELVRLKVNVIVATRALCIARCGSRPLRFPSSSRSLAIRSPAV